MFNHGGWQGLLLKEPQEQRGTVQATVLAHIPVTHLSQANQCMGANTIII